MKLMTAVFLLLVVPSLAHAGNGRRHKGKAPSSLSKVCSSVQPLGSRFLYKAEISPHIPSGDARASGPTLVCNSDCPKFPAEVYYSDGSLAHKLGYYGRWDVTGKARAYCAAGGAPKCFTSQIARNSRARTRSGRRNGRLYVKMTTASPGRCVEIMNPAGRNGSAT